MSAERVRKIPSGLDEISAQMMRHIKTLDDAGQCKKVLLTLVSTYRPLHLSELATLAGLPRLAVHQEIVRHCGLLTIREDNDIVYFRNLPPYSDTSPLPSLTHLPK